MTSQNNDTNQQPSRALIPAPPHSIEPKQGLLAPTPQKLALGVTISAIGSLFVKRLVELAAEELYRVSRNTIERALTNQQEQKPPAESPAVEVLHNEAINEPTDLPVGYCYRRRTRFSQVRYHRVRQGRTNRGPKNSD